MTIEDRVKTIGKGFVERFLLPWLRMPSISPVVVDWEKLNNPGTTPYVPTQDQIEEQKRRDAGINAAAGYLSEELESLGFDVERIELARDNDIVYAQRVVDPSLPTVLVYGHYDVQPADSWDISGYVGDGSNFKNAQPFEPTFVPEQDRIYGRGTTDDKGQVAAHLLALRALGDDLSCNVKFVIEGNEESEGAGDFPRWVKANKERLACDVVLVSDTSTLVEDHPAMVTSLKGIVVSQVESDDPRNLVDMISSLHDPVNNRVNLKGFYDGVVEMQISDEVRELKERNFDENVGVLKPEQGFGVAEHAIARPTFSPLGIHYSRAEMSEGKHYEIKVFGPKIDGLHSGTFGGPVVEPGLTLAHVLSRLNDDIEIDVISYGSKDVSTKIRDQAGAVITYDGEETLRVKIALILDGFGLDDVEFSVSDVEDVREYQNAMQPQKASVNLSSRLVAGQEPQSVYDGFSERAEEFDCEVLGEGHKAQAFYADPNSTFVAAVARGLEKGYGKEGVHFYGEGGSIPICSTLHEVTGAPVALAGFSTPSDALHSPHESFRVQGGLYAGAKSIAYALENIGSLASRDA